MTSPLPRDGSVRFDELRTHLAHAATWYKTSQRIQYRIVAFRDSAGIVRPFARRLVVGAEHLADSKVIELGRVTLIHVEGDVEDFSTDQLTCELLASWRAFMKGATGSETIPQDVQIYREHSVGRRARCPSWYFTLASVVQPQVNSPAMSDPLFDSRENFFAKDIGDATAQWLSMPWLRDATQPAGGIEVTFHDERAFFGDVVRDDDSIVASVARRITEALFVTTVQTSYSGHRTHRILPLTNESIRVPLLGGTRDLELYLHSETGFCFDWLTENEYGTTRPQSLLLPQLEQMPGPTALVKALDEGESERMEFKEWLPMERSQAKSGELLRTVCAFANTRGGSLYIGVTDDLRVVGCARPLREFAKSLKATAAEGANLYVKAVRCVVAEGLSPSVSVNLEWVSYAGLDVLRVDVSASKAIHHVVESRETYVRRGGNCAKATAGDIERLIETRRTQD